MTQLRANTKLEQRACSIDRLRWADTVDLWFAYNRQLAHVIQAIPESRRDVACFIGDDPQVTLAHIALDYVAHLQHHLRQILP